MLVLYILLALFGLLMVFKPAVVWTITESWKSNDATEPSGLYVWSIRFGGVMCTAAGIAAIIALFL
jgi:hypothetical protein